MKTALAIKPKYSLTSQKISVNNEIQDTKLKLDKNNPTTLEKNDKPEENKSHSQENQEKVSPHHHKYAMPSHPSLSDKEKKDQYSNESIVKNLRKLFCCYATNDQREILSKHKFIKMINDADIFYKSKDVTKLDLIFVKVNKKKLNLTFELFCEVMLKVAELKYPHEYNKHECMYNLLRDYIYPLLLKIHDANNNFGDIINTDRILKEISSEEVKTYFGKENIELLSIIYMYYFYNSFRHIEKQEMILTTQFEKKNVIEVNPINDLIEFLKDFEFHPKMISVSKIVECYQKISFIDDFKNCFGQVMSDYGDNRFSFYHFLAVSVYIARTIFNDQATAKECKL